MYTFKGVEIEGISAHLGNRFLSPEKLGKRGTGGTSSLEAEIEAAKRKSHFENESICCPAINLKSSMIAAAGMVGLKYGKKSIAPFMRAWLFIEPVMIPFNKAEPDFIDSRVATNRNVGKGVAVLVHRPGLNAGWKLTFDIVVMDDRLPREHIETALKEAGTLTAIGSYRPEFGRFKVNKFDIDK